MLSSGLFVIKIGNVELQANSAMGFAELLSIPLFFGFCSRLDYAS